MMVITYLAFCTLGVIYVGLHNVSWKNEEAANIGNNPIFLQFQKSYFLAYLPAVFADWLQGPYLYKLYSHYGFQEDQIAVLYVCGFASTVLFGTWAPVAAENFGRKKMCLLFNLIYSVACFMKLSDMYYVLLIGRILGGIATSLLFSSFEAWYLHEHIDKNDFPKEWIPVTFDKANIANSVLAVVAGVVANMFAEWFGLGPVSPFMLAIPCLFASSIMIMKWEENYGQQQVQFKKNCMDGLRKILVEPRLFLIGIIQSLFESVMNIFIFMWTPVLAKGHPSLGITFASFMVCIMIGSLLYKILSHKHVHDFTLLASTILTALAAILVCVYATDPDNPDRNLAFIAFLVWEISIGVYFSAMGNIRSKILPEANRISILNWFRVPLNLIACVVLMLLHNQTSRHGNRLIFATCSGLLGLAAICVFQFITMVKNDEEFKSKDVESGENQVNG